MKQKGTPHLSDEFANSLLKDAMNIYKQHHNEQLPNRIVVHKSSRYEEFERKGFLDACDSVPKYDLVSIGADLGDVFLYRNGDNPVLRGTTLALGNAAFMLYTRGYVPFLHGYNGLRFQGL